MSNYLFISDAAKEVKVESHVLRYWEEELHLPIKRNELGHRYYTEEDVERFKQIKGMKERGLQLKAIKMILRDGKLDVLPMDGTQAESTGSTERDVREREQGVELQEEAAWERTTQKKSAQDELGLAIEIVDSRDRQVTVESKEDKSRRLQWLLQQLIRETLRENNSELCQEIKDSVVKELDYQFRMQEERDEARDKMLVERNEEHYKKMDELLRKKTKTRQFRLGKKKKGTSQ